MGGIDLIKVVVGKRPGVLVQVAELVPPVIHGIEIHPALADIEAAADVEASQTGWRHVVHEERMAGLGSVWLWVFDGESRRDFSSKAQFQDRNSRKIGKCSRNQNSG
jgi:hypothetical protein